MGPSFEWLFLQLLMYLIHINKMINSDLLYFRRILEKVISFLWKISFKAFNFFLYKNVCFASTLLFSVVCCCSVTKLCPTLCDPIDCSPPGSSILHYLQEYVQIHVHWVSGAINHLILCHPLFLLPSVFPSIRVFSSESALHQVAEVLAL